VFMVVLISPINMYLVPIAPGGYISSCAIEASYSVDDQCDSGVAVSSDDG